MIASLPLRARSGGDCYFPQFVESICSVQPLPAGRNCAGVLTPTQREAILTIIKEPLEANNIRRSRDAPHSGAQLIEHSLEKFNFRMIIVGSYIAFYRFIDNIVYVYRISHGARDYASLLKHTME